MDVLDEVEIWSTANDNEVLSDYVFTAQSLIRQRVGFFDWKTPWVRHCHTLVSMALDHYQMMMDNIDRPDLHVQWKETRDERIEDALSDLEDRLHQLGIQVS
jgi:hypothetical protein